MVVRDVWDEACGWSMGRHQQHLVTEMSSVVSFTSVQACSPKQVRAVVMAMPSGLQVQDCDHEFPGLM